MSDEFAAGVALSNQSFCLTARSGLPSSVRNQPFSIGSRKRPRAERMMRVASDLRRAASGPPAQAAVAATASSASAVHT